MWRVGQVRARPQLSVMRSIIDRQIDSPSPKLPGFVVLKASNTRSTSAGGGDEDRMTSAAGTFRTSRDVRLESDMVQPQMGRKRF
jgi:hypothetical protein